MARKLSLEQLLTVKELEKYNSLKCLKIMSATEKQQFQALVNKIKSRNMRHLKHVSDEG